MKQSNEHDDIEMKFEQEKQSLKTKIISEIFKRKSIEAKVEEINTEVNCQKDEYIDSLNDKYDEHVKRIEEAGMDIERSIESNNLEEIQKSFQNMLNSIKD